MEFKEFNHKLRAHVDKMTKGVGTLFVVDIDKDVLYNLYLDSFPEEMNPVYRERREFDCSCCRHFIKDVGNVISLKDGKRTTIWDFAAGHEGYQKVLDALSSVIKAAPILDAFVPVTLKYGTAKSIEALDDGRMQTWNHFCAELNKSVKTYNSAQVGYHTGQKRDSRNVLERSFNEINLLSLDSVLELISQNSLYRGEQWAEPLKKFRKMHQSYSGLSEQERADYCWRAADEAGPAVSRIKNHSIGVLLKNITDGMDLDSAVRAYEAIVAPSNYQRSKPIFTKQMLEKAKQTVKDLGYEKSLARRHALLEDITINNVLWANRNAKKAMGEDVFDLLAETIPAKPNQFSRVEEISAQDFVENVLPNLSSLEVLFENKHKGNLVSLVAPKDKEAKSLMKWPNNFSWSYSGNVTDSMKERVKKAGGKVDGDLRFSIQWNEAGDNEDDLDAHCKEPSGNHIYYASKTSRYTEGKLDVDIQVPDGNVAVENITWESRVTMQKGTYLFFVENFRNRGSKSGFTAEIEFDGKVYNFSYAYPLKNKEIVKVAEVSFNGKTFKLKPLLDTQKPSREIWGIQTENFHPVSSCMYSPNYWDGHKGTGHRHVFFMIDGCKNNENPSGFFNEFLSDDLREHRKVFEALSLKMSVEDSENQLSGLGFSTTKRESLVVRAKGATERVLKILF